jgi:hypothetical protein
MCNKEYSSYKSLWQHNKKYHTTNSSCEHTNKKKKKTKKYICGFCDKLYANSSNLNRHKKICKNKITTQIYNSNALELSDQKTIESILKLLSQSINGINNHSRNSTQNMSNSQNTTNHMSDSQNTTNNIINSGNTNNITVYALGNENISEILSDAEQKNILKQKTNSLEEIIKLVHFNKKYPQFHNIAIDDDIGYKYDSKSKTFIEVPKDDLIHAVVVKRGDDIGEINKRQKIHIPKTTYSSIDEYISSIGTDSNSKLAKETAEYAICDGTYYLTSTKKIKLPNISDEEHL